MIKCSIGNMETHWACKTTPEKNCRLERVKKQNEPLNVVQTSKSLGIIKTEKMKTPRSKFRNLSSERWPMRDHGDHQYFRPIVIANSASQKWFL